MRHYHVYILANESRRICMGVTSDLLGRICKHRMHFHPRSHTSRFRIARLAYFEEHGSITVAIAREKQLRRWPRWRKVSLVERHNAGWRDLSVDWFPDERRLLEHDAPGEA